MKPITNIMTPPSRSARHLPYGIGEDNVSPCAVGGVVRTANRGGHLLCWLFFVFALSGCKINLNILGSGNVQGSTDGTTLNINCTSDGENQTGDCTQTFNVDDTTACDPEDADCTIVAPEQTVTETLIATPAQYHTFNGWSDCGLYGGGASACSLDIDYDDAQDGRTSTITAQFDTEVTPAAATYTHNFLGQRVSKVTNGVTTYFIYDEQGHLLSEMDAAGNSVKDYVYLEGEYIAHVEKTGDTSLDEWGNPKEQLEQVFLPVNDHLGQPIQVWRSDGKPSYEGYFGPFGELYATYTDTSLGIGPTAQNIRFPGQYYDAETAGYNQNWNRDYDPSTGRYIESDPIGLAGGINMYGYALQNPIMYTDPYGLWSWGGWGCLFGLCVSGGPDGSNSVGGSLTLAGGGFYICTDPPDPCFSPQDNGGAPDAYSAGGIAGSVSYGLNGQWCVWVGPSLSSPINPYVDGGPWK